MAGSNGNSSYYDLFGEEPQYYDSPSLSAQLAAQPVPKTPTFDQNLGRDTAYNEQYAKYKKELGLRGVFERKKAKQYFDQQFNEDWNNSAQDRQNKALERMGYSYNGSGWDLPEIKEPQPIQNPAQKAASGFWDAINSYNQNVKNDVYIPNQNLKTNGLDFTDTKAVQQWLTDNGFDTKGVDGMYGANTRNAINTMLNSDNFALTAKEKEAFRNFQNNATFVRAKQPASVKVKTPIVEQPIQNQSQQTIVEEKPVHYDTKYIPGQGEIAFNPEPQNNSSALNKVSSKQNHWGHRWAKPFEGATGLGKDLANMFIWMGDNGMFQKQSGYQQPRPVFKKQGGTINAEQQELQLALIGYVIATKKQPKDENEINQLAQTLVQLKQQDPEQFAQLVQLGQQAQSQKAEKGAKLNYIKSLKGQCPDGEELVYFKKGGMIDCGCQKKETGGEVKSTKKLNPVEEFKKGRKTKKC